jgi:hypothetical protein
MCGFADVRIVRRVYRMLREKAYPFVQKKPRNAGLLQLNSFTLMALPEKNLRAVSL